MTDSMKSFWNLTLHTNRWLMVALVTLTALSVRADVQPVQLFTDNMVIQRDTQAPVWGWADPGEKITVTGSWGKTASTTADKDGKWKVKLQTPPAGGPISSDGQPLHEFTICGSDHKFVAARVKIVGNTVVVSSAKVSEPVAVRYAWKNGPIVNLFGMNGLPVGPFRTDDFELKPNH